MRSDYLTQDELLYALEHEGLDVSERTIRFWISKGVLEKPVRKPFKHADGRMRYFPTRVVGEIADIVKLQEEGWKLTQIKRRLRATTRVGQTEGAASEELAKLLLADFLGNGEFKDRSRIIDAADPSTPPWRRVRNFLVARLSHFVGRKQAVRSVTSFMLGLSKRDTAKLLRLTAGVRQEPPQASEQTTGRLGPNRVAALRGVLSRLTEPVWEGDTQEPLLSRQLRSEIARLRALTSSETGGDNEPLSQCLARLRELRKEVAHGIEFLK